ncbi:hypothetical protein D3C85_990490 [compost metagenome]
MADALLQQGQHHVAAAKHQTARPIEVGDQLAGGALGQQRQADKQQGKQQQGRPVGDATGLWRRRRGADRLPLGAEQGRPQKHSQLGQQTGLPPEGGGGCHHDSLLQHRLAELAAHGEHGIRHHHQRQQLEAVQGPIQPEVIA